MPIRPENMDRYPGGSIRSKEWRNLRASILERAGNACEQCRVPNHAAILRGQGDDKGTFMMVDGACHHEDSGTLIDYVLQSDFDSEQWVRIVLTIAHMDHDEGNNDLRNLAALCQLHHNRHDAPHRAQTRRRTRREQMALRDLFEPHQQEPQR